MAYNSIRGSVGGVVDGAGSITKTALAGGVVVLAGPEVVEGIGDIVKDFGSTETGQAIVNWVNGTIGESAQEPAFLKSWQQTFITFIKETAWPWVQALPTTLSETIQSWTTASADIGTSVATAGNGTLDVATLPDGTELASLDTQKITDVSPLPPTDDTLLAQGNITGAQETGATNTNGEATDAVEQTTGAEGERATGNNTVDERSLGDQAGAFINDLSDGATQAYDTAEGFVNDTIQTVKDNPEVAAGVGAAALAGTSYAVGRSHGYNKAERETAGKFTKAELQRQQAALANMDPQLG